MRLLGGDPPVNQPVAYGQGQRIVPVAVRGAVAILRQGEAEMALELLPQTGGRPLRVSVSGRSSAPCFCCHRFCSSYRWAARPALTPLTVFYVVVHMFNLLRILFQQESYFQIRVTIPTASRRRRT